MAKVIVVRDKDGNIEARISPFAYNANVRIDDAIRQAGSGGTVMEEEDPDFVDLVGMPFVKK